MFGNLTIGMMMIITFVVIIFYVFLWFYWIKPAIYDTAARTWDYQRAIREGWTQRQIEDAGLLDGYRFGRGPNGQVLLIMPRLQVNHDHDDSTYSHEGASVDRSQHRPEAHPRQRKKKQKRGKAKKNKHQRGASSWDVNDDGNFNIELMERTALNPNAGQNSPTRRRDSPSASKPNQNAGQKSPSWRGGSPAAINQQTQSKEDNPASHHGTTTSPKKQGWSPKASNAGKPGNAWADELYVDPDVTSKIHLTQARHLTGLKKETHSPKRDPDETTES